MNFLRYSRRVAVFALMLMFASLLDAPMGALASAGDPPTVPSDIAVPAGSVLLFSSHARGQQIYECKSGAWALHAPHANLFDPATHQRVGIHYGGIDKGLNLGPWWESLADGSSIRGGNAKSAPSPNPDSIPLLRLEVLEHAGSGMFSPVAFIQRLNTEGGLAPAGACKPNQQRRVNYTADYYFYGNGQ